jgi:hypothetical protein
VFRDRRCILVGGVLVGAHAAVRQCLSVGARRPVLVVCDTIGVGEAPDPNEAVPLLVDERSVSTIETIRRFERALEHPSAEITDALQDFDPDRSALVLGSPFSTARTLDGRPRFGLRRPEWAAFEDKTKSVSVLTEAGALPLATAVVPNQVDEIAAAVNRVASADGAVISGDTASGHTGFSEYTRWVRSPADVEVISGCAQVRVMPFVRGVPCSVHGMVIGDDIAVFRPVEMLTFIDERSRFVFAGSATYWDPPTQHRDEMRTVARRVGQLMANRASYQGAFTVDGVLTSAGFVATEINARWGGAFNLIAGVSPELPLFVMDHALREGLDITIDVDLLEEAVLDAADARREGAAYLSLTGDWPSGDRERTVRLDGTTCSPAEPWHFRLQAGAMRGGVHIRAVPNPDLPQRTTPFANLAARAIALAAPALGVPVPNLRAQADGRPA